MALRRADVGVPKTFAFLTNVRVMLREPGNAVTVEKGRERVRDRADGIDTSEAGHFFGLESTEHCEWDVSTRRSGLCVAGLS
jgi:hypothetical protein